MKLKTLLENPEEQRLHKSDVDYQGPENGPFKCGHCVFFVKEKSVCSHPKIRAHVEAEGCCNKYKKQQ